MIPTTWLGASYAVAQFNYQVANDFCLQGGPFAPPAGCNCILVVGYMVGQVKTRYMLWQGLGEVMFFPLYTNQPIKSKFFLEVWSVAVGNPTLPASMNIMTSILFNLTRMILVPVTPQQIGGSGTQVVTLASLNGLNLPLQFGADAVYVGN